MLGKIRCLLCEYESSFYAAGRIRIICTSYYDSMRKPLSVLDKIAHLYQFVFAAITHYRQRLVEVASARCPPPLVLQLAMSFGYSVGDAVLLSQLAWKTVQNARKACGEHDELTREALSLHVVLRRLEQDAEKPGSPINRPNDTYKEELDVVFDGCKKVLNVLDQVLTKYNALSDQERSGRKLLARIRFGNGKMADMVEMRGKLAYHSSAMSLFLNMVSMGSMGRVEQRMNDAGGDLKEIKVAVNGITAHLMSTSIRHEGSVLTAYADDDRAVWKEFRRELLEDGFSSSTIQKHKAVIKAYIEELGSRGLFDEGDPNVEAESQYCDAGDMDFVIKGALVHDAQAQNVSEASLGPTPEAQMPIQSELPLDFRTKLDAIFNSRTESERKEGPSPDRSASFGSQTEPEAQLHGIRLRNESNEGNHESRIKDTPPPSFVAESNTANTDRDQDKSTDIEGSKQTSRSEPYGEGDKSDTVVNRSNRGSKQGHEQTAERSQKRKSAEPSNDSDKCHIGKRYDGLECNEALIRDYNGKPFEALSGQELTMNVGEQRTNPYGKAKDSVALRHNAAHETHNSTVISPSPRLDARLRPTLSAKEKPWSDRKDNERDSQFHKIWHHYHDDIAQRCLTAAYDYQDSIVWLPKVFYPASTKVSASRDAISLLLDEITEAQENLKRLKRPGLPSHREDEFKADMKMMIRALNFPNTHYWNNRCDMPLKIDGEGYRVIVEMIKGRSGYLATFGIGNRCALCTLS